MTPREVWEALKGKGVNPDKEYKKLELKEKTAESTTTKRDQSYYSWKECDEEDRLAYIRDCREEYSDYSFTRNGTLANAIASQDSLNKKPDVLSKEDFDRIVKENDMDVIFRGITSLISDDGDLIKSSDEIMKGFKDSDDDVYGGGNYGSGYHFFSSKGNGSTSIAMKKANGFADPESDGKVIVCAVKKDAKFLDSSEWEKLPEKEKKKYDYDSGLYSLTHGYDGITSGNGVINIQNRAALIIRG